MEYRIIGEPMPVVECKLNPGEAMKTEKGSMVWMSPNMHMSTNGGGGIGKAFGRMFSGESMFQNVYTAERGSGLIAFASSFTGSVRAVDLRGGKRIICQKSAFLASEMGVDLKIHFQKRASAGFFGGEGFIMQECYGDGIVFLEIDGSAVEYDLSPGQSMIIDTGCLAYMDASCQIEVVEVKGLKNKFLGGEGWFNTKVTGPGKIVLQTMTIAGLAGALAPYLHTGD